jgi:hypothetical protein
MITKTAPIPEVDVQDFAALLTFNFFKEWGGQRTDCGTNQQVLRNGI